MENNFNNLTNNFEKHEIFDNITTTTNRNDLFSFLNRTISLNEWNNFNTNMRTSQNEIFNLFYSGIYAQFYDLFLNQLSQTTANVTTITNNQPLLSPDYQFINIFYRNALLQQHAQSLEFLRNTESLTAAKKIIEPVSEEEEEEEEEGGLEEEESQQQLASVPSPRPPPPPPPHLQERLEKKISQKYKNFSIKYDNEYKTTRVQCNICAKSLSCKTNLKRHTKTHDKKIKKTLKKLIGGRVQKLTY